MSKLNVDQKTIKDLFQDKKADFLIPDYQRPYAWGETECQTLWDDIFSFAIPDEGRVEFDSNSEYFLGPIVTFRNTNFKMEVIDGQQRLTTLMLLLRAFYTKFGHMQDMLDDDAFYQFLNRITGFIWTYAVTNPGVNALRTPVYAEMVNIVNNRPVSFDGFKFEPATVKSMFANFAFSNTRPITKSMLAWWAFQDDLQELISLETVLEIEHIYARNRFDKDKSLSDVKNLEAIGNKALLEKRINIRAADYRFSDKIKYYQGFTNSRNQKKEGTKNHELISLATAADFTEDDIRNRTRQIMTAFLTFLSENSLTK